MKERRADTEKARDENEEVEHLEMELNEFPGNWGGIVAYECPAQLHSSVVDKTLEKFGWKLRFELARFSHTPQPQIFRYQLHDFFS